MEAEDQISMLSSILLRSTDPSDIQSSTHKLLSLCRHFNHFPSQQQISLISKKLLSDANPSLRILGLKIIRKMWSSMAPTSQDIISHFIQDIDPGVRAAALKATISSTNPNEVIKYFQDLNNEVKIAAMRLYVKISKNSDHDLIVEKLIPQTFSNSSIVVLETLRLIGTLKPSVRALKKSLTIDDKMPYSGFLLYTFESEFCDVRLGAIDSISSILSNMLPVSYDENIGSLVYLVVKVLLDIINDEFREVRITVFKFLSTLAPYFLLKKKADVDSCIFNLRDADSILRQAIYDFLCKVRIDNAAHAQIILEVLKNQALLALFTIFPEDTDYIFSVAANMGRQNNKHGKFLLNRLLGVDRRFLSNDQNWNDPIYIAKLLFLVNANTIARNVEIPVSCEKHVNYLSELYPLHMPPRVVFCESDLDMPQEGNAEFVERCRVLHKKVNSMVKKPVSFYHEAEVYVKSVLKECCEIQNCYIIEYPKPINEFIMSVKLQAHIIYLLSMLAHVYTGRRTPLTTIRSQIENIWKAAALTNSQDLITKCHDAHSNPTESIYDSFFYSLCTVDFPMNLAIKVVKKSAEITFPFGERIINECDVLNIQGHGSESLYCVVELPDGTIESAKATSHSSHLNSYIRIPKPNSQVCVQICFAVLLNLADFITGPGLHHKTLQIQSYIPVSTFVALVLKPSHALN